MSSLRLPFADGVYSFRLLVGELMELEEKTNAGPMELYRRLLNGTWRSIDVTETLRLALLCGGEGWPGAVLDDAGEPEGGQRIEVSAVVANKLVHRYVATYGAPAFDPDQPTPGGGAQPWAISAIVASQVLERLLMGRSLEELGKKRGGETPVPSLSPTGESDGPPSSPASPNEE